MKEVDYEGEKATVFAILPWGQSTEVELFVRTRDKRPIAIRAQGQQSSYATTVVQLETKLSFRKEFWTWTPPEGAKKR